MCIRDRLKGAAIGGLTAGLTNGITLDGSGVGFSMSGSPDSLASLAGVQNVGNSLVPQAGASTAGSLPMQAAAMAGDALVQAGVKTAIDGGSFLTSLRNSAVSDAAAAGAYAIGNAFSDQSGFWTTSNPLYVAEHAALGCAASAAEGTGCAGGALGGAVSAAFSPDVVKAIDPTGAPLDPGQQAALAAFATLAGGGLAGLAGVNVNGAMTAAQNEALNNAGKRDPGQGGLLSALANTAYTLMPWLPGNPATQAISQAFQGPVYQPNGAADPPADDLGNVTGSSGGGNNPSAPAVVTSFAMALCAASGGEACGLMGMLSPASSSPLPPTNSTLSSGNNGQRLDGARHFHRQWHTGPSTVAH